MIRAFQRWQSEFDLVDPSFPLFLSLCLLSLLSIQSFLLRAWAIDISIRISVMISLIFTSLSIRRILSLSIARLPTTSWTREQTLLSIRFFFPFFSNRLANGVDSRWWSPKAYFNRERFLRDSLRVNKRKLSGHTGCSDKIRVFNLIVLSKEKLAVFSLFSPAFPMYAGASGRDEERKKKIESYGFSFQTERKYSLLSLPREELLLFLLTDTSFSWLLEREKQKD